MPDDVIAATDARRPDDTIQEVVGVFRDMDALDAAVTELQCRGFDRTDLSIVSGTEAVRRLGRPLESVKELEDDPGVPRTVFVSKVSLGDAMGALIGVPAYVGAVAAAIVAAADDHAFGTVALAAAIAGLAGALIGYAVARWIETRYVRRFREQMAAGGVVLFAQIRNDIQKERAIETLATYSAEDVHVHEVPAVQFSPEALSRGASFDLSFMKRLGL